MKVGLYAIYDTASGVYDGPVPMKTDAVAIRQFQHAVMSADNPISKNPEHFSLHRVGEWNDATGLPEPQLNKQCLMTGMEAVSSMQNVKPINEDIDLGEIGNA